MNLPGTARAGGCRIPWDLVAYITAIVVLLVILLAQLPWHEETGASDANSPDASGIAAHVYSAVMWIILPLALFIGVNIRAHRAFHRRLREGGLTVGRPLARHEASPIVRAKDAPTVRD